VSTIVSYSSPASGHTNQQEHTKTEGEHVPARGIVVYQAAMHKERAVVSGGEEAAVWNVAIQVCGRKEACVHVSCRNSLDSRHWERCADQAECSCC